jgi:23S rRNA (cytidine2498-2'-O)-methyltransferase
MPIYRNLFAARRCYNSGMTNPSFIFITCQVGAEPAVKNEIARKWPLFRFAYSRPGFITFKIPVGAALADDFDLHSVFARSYGFSLGKVTGESLAEKVEQTWKLAEGREFDSLHVWQRDLYEPGRRGYEPGLTELAAEADDALRSTQGVPPSVVAAGQPALEPKLQPANSPQNEHQQNPAATTTLEKPRRFEPPNMAGSGRMVLDCVLVEPNEWWVGYHRASSIQSRWPGGLFPIELPTDAVSRAYLKMEEALAWSRMTTKAGDVWAEIGSAPGGASQALLKRQLHVIGIDPADMDPIVLANPNFKHIKMRGADVRRREFREVKYLAADVNVAPTYTLDTVEAIVTHADVNIRGLILTLKFLEWKLADELPLYLDRIRSWGFRQVRARQLHHNRQEVCVAAKR